MEKQENLSQSKYAEHRNVTKGYIARLIKEGRLHLIKGKLNVEMSDAELDNKSNKVIFTTLPFIFVNPIGSLLSLEILIDRPVTRFPSMKKVSPSTAIPIDEETMFLS